MKAKLMVAMSVGLLSLGAKAELIKGATSQRTVSCKIRRQTWQNSADRMGQSVFSGEMVAGAVLLERQPVLAPGEVAKQFVITADEKLETDPAILPAIDDLAAGMPGPVAIPGQPKPEMPPPSIGQVALKNSARYIDGTVISVLRSGTGKDDVGNVVIIVQKIRASEKAINGLELETVGSTQTVEPGQLAVIGTQIKGDHLASIACKSE